MIRKFLYLYSLFLVFAGKAMACPACAGSLQNPKDKYLVYALMIFIVLIYIPFYFLYRTIIKNRNLNELTIPNEQK